jgi:dTDP-4-dehydrorhamnose reductase
MSSHILLDSTRPVPPGQCLCLSLIPYSVERLLNVLVVGANGMLGAELVNALGQRRLRHRGIDVDELDITDPVAVSSVLAAQAPQVVVNCAAYTAVDRAEEDRAAAISVNADGPANLARAAKEVGALLVHFSTDFVFDGQKGAPYRVFDETNPLSVYGQSKLMGEEFVRREGHEYLIVRTSWLYGGNGPNFVSAILNKAKQGQDLRVVDDQVGRPTWTRDLATATLDLIQIGARGIFHVTGGGHKVSWLGFAQRALELSSLGARVSGIAAEEWGALARRPSYSVLDNSATEAIRGRPMPDWDVALRQFLEDTAA